jgi:hypothetical protein
MLRFATVVLFSLCAVSISGQAAYSPSEQALVTFYSSGPAIFGKPGSLGAFMGNVYVDGHQFGRLERHRFVTFKLDPGLHDFALSFWTSNRPDDKARITMNLDAGRSYFISTNFEGTSWLGGMALLVREVTCEAAQADNASAASLDPKHIKPDGVAAAVSGGSLPQCE